MDYVIKCLSNLLAAICFMIITAFHFRKYIALFLVMQLSRETALMHGFAKTYHAKYFQIPLTKVLLGLVIFCKMTHVETKAGNSVHM